MNSSQIRRISTMRSVLSPSNFINHPFLHPPKSPPPLLPIHPIRASRNPRPFERSAVMLRLRSCTSASKSYGVGPSDGPMEARSTSSGEIHVILGPMFAGKTTALLRRIRSESENGRRVILIKSDKDTRYGLESVVTHDGTKMPCLALSKLSVFRAKLGVEAYNKLDVIGIDEAQFFDDLYDFCCNAADHDGKTVVVAGLDGDYLRRRFGSVLDIIPLADSVMKLTSRCAICGKPALFTQRKTAETQTELIGGADVYMPVCRHHYVNGHHIVEAARMVSDSPAIQCGSLC